MTQLRLAKIFMQRLFQWRTPEGWDVDKQFPALWRPVLRRERVIREWGRLEIVCRWVVTFNTKTHVFSKAARVP